MERSWFSSSAQKRRPEGNPLTPSKSRLPRLGRLKCAPAQLCQQLPNKSGGATGHHHTSRARPVKPLYEQLTQGGERGKGSLPKLFQRLLALDRSRQQRCRALRAPRLTVARKP